MRELNLELFHRNVEYLCRKKEMSVADLTRIADISSQSLYQAKAKGYIPSLSSVVKIADTLNVTIDDLLFFNYEELEGEIAKHEEAIRFLKEKIGYGE